MVSHALRHIAFLIQAGDQEDFAAGLMPESMKVFMTIWGTLAGEVFETGSARREIGAAASCLS